MKWFSLSALVVLLDQATKLLADARLVFHEPVSVLPFFNLRLAYNTGAAFSFLGNAGGWQRWFFITVGIVVSVVMAVWLGRLRREERLTAYGLALVIGGADGIDPGLRARADFGLSLGAMVWPHMLVRVMLAEQLYRAATILAGGPYHRE